MGGIHYSAKVTVLLVQAQQNDLPFILPTCCSGFFPPSTSESEEGDTGKPIVLAGILVLTSARGTG